MTTRRLSVSSLVISSIVVITSLILGGVTAFLYHQDRQTALFRLHEYVASDADQLASGLALSIWNLDDAQIQRNMESALGSNYVTSVKVEADGTQGFHLERPGLAPPNKETALPEKDRIRETRSIFYAGKQIGSVTLYATPEIILSQLRERLIFLAGVLLAFEVCLVFALASLLWRTILTPLQLLERYALSVSNAPSLAPVSHSRPFRGELETLRSSLEEMIGLLRKRNAELEKEAKLRKANEERIRAVYDSVNDAIFIYEPDSGVILDLNSRACEMFGNSRQNILGSSLHALKQQLDLPDEEQARLGHTERLCRRRDDSQFWGEFNVRNVRIDDMDRKLLVVRDITSRKQEESERQRLELQLNQAQKLESIGILAGGIAHDFNNILAAIMGYCELAKEDTRDMPLVQEYIGDVLKATARAKDLVRQILSFSRQEKKEVHPVALEEVTREVVKLLKATYPDSIQFHLNIPAGLPKVSADPSQIHQILMNLCANAEYAMRGRQGSLTVSVDSFLADDSAADLSADLVPGNYVRLSVADSGHGMDAETLRHIFDPFFTTKKSSEGTGLGLSVVHGIMKSHHGAITVYSRPGEGSVFTLYFPALEGERGTNCPSDTQAMRGQGQKVLFVDNELALCRMAEKVLQKLGYEPTVLSDPIAALKHLGENKGRYALLISDLSMPGMSGLELAEQVLKQCPTLPILIMTGYVVPENVEEAKRLGVAELLMKPLDTIMLSAAIRRNLRAQGTTAP